MSRLNLEGAARTQSPGAAGGNARPLPDSPTIRCICEDEFDVIGCPVHGPPAPARIAYADPPYPGQSKKHYGDHPDYAGEVDHRALAEHLTTFDGWVLHTSSPSLFHVQQALRNTGEYPQMEDGSFRPGTYRVMAWVKPFAAFKRNVSVAYAWEPVLVKPCRKPVVSGRCVMRDFISESITLKRGLTGAKPDAVCRWAFEVVGADRDDEMHDLFPGSGAVTRAWDAWRSQEAFAV